MLAGCTAPGGGGGGGGDETPSLSAVRLANGATSLIEPAIVEQGYDQENGFELEVIVRTDIGAYYADFASGSYDAIPAGLGTAANQYNQGVGMKILGGFNRPSTFILAPPGESVDSMADLEGATVSAPLSAGAFKTADMLSLLTTGSTFEDLVGNVVNSPGPVNPILELNQGNVDYAMSWEPAITVQLANEEINFDRVINVRDGLQAEDAFGRDAWYLLWAVRENAYNNNTEAARGLIAASQQVGDLIDNELETFLDVVERRTENPREPIREALETGNLAYEFTPVNEIQSDLNDQLEVFSEIGIVDEVPGDDFYGDVS